VSSNDLEVASLVIAKCLPCLIITCESLGWSQTAGARSVKGALLWARGDSLFSWFLVRFSRDINLKINKDILFCQAVVLITSTA